MKSTISTQIAEMIGDALERGLDQGEPIEYDCGVIAVPGPNGQPSPMIGIAFTIQALNLDQGHGVMFLMPPSIPAQEDIDGLVRRIVQGLIEQRAQANAQAMETLHVHGSENGHKDIPGNVSKSGLILPGQG